MPGGDIGLIFFAGCPIIISVIALLVNGTDYFFMGLLGTGTGPIVYLIFKRVYGGMYKTDPINHPLNSKTKLAFGDSIRVGVYMTIAGVFAFLGQFWLKWYEIDYGEWEPADYDMFGNHIPMILDVLKWGGIILAIIGIVVVLIGKTIEKDKYKI